MASHFCEWSHPPCQFFILKLCLEHLVEVGQSLVLVLLLLGLGLGALVHKQLLYEAEVVEPAVGSMSSDVNGAGSGGKGKGVKQSISD